MCSDTNPNLPGWVDAPATTTPRGSNSAANCSALGALRPATRRGQARARSAHLDERVDGDRRSVGRDDQRVDVDARDVVALGDQPPEPDQRPRQDVTVDRRLAAELAEQPGRGEVVDHLRGRRRRRAEPGRNTTSAIASARTPPTPSMTVGPNCGSRTSAGDQLAIALHHRRHEHVRPSPSSGVAAASSSAAAAATPRRRSREIEAHEAALGLVGDRVTVELGDDRIPDLVGRGDRTSRVVGEPFRGDRHAVRGQELLRRAF